MNFEPGKGKFKIMQTTVRRTRVQIPIKRLRQSVPARWPSISDTNHLISLLGNSQIKFRIWRQNEYHQYGDDWYQGWSLLYERIHISDSQAAGKLNTSCRSLFTWAIVTYHMISYVVYHIQHGIQYMICSVQNGIESTTVLQLRKPKKSKKLLLKCVLENWIKRQRNVPPEIAKSHWKVSY